MREDLRGLKEIGRRLIPKIDPGTWQRAIEVFSQVTRENQHTDIHKQPENFLLTFGSLPGHPRAVSV